MAHAMPPNDIIAFIFKEALDIGSYSMLNKKPRTGDLDTLSILQPLNKVVKCLPNNRPSKHRDRAVALTKNYLTFSLPKKKTSLFGSSKGRKKNLEKTFSLYNVFTKDSRIPLYVYVTTAVIKIS